MAKVKLNDVAIEARETWKQSKTDVPVVGLEHLEPDEIWLRRWDLNPDENTFTKGFKKGQLLFGRRRAYQKKMSVASCDGICSGDITVIAARPEKILPELLPFYLRTDSFFDFAVRGSGGSLSPRVKWSHISDYEFDLPPMEEQKKLSELLWAANDLKEKYKKAITATDEMLKAKFREMFGCVGNGERGMGRILTQRRREGESGLAAKNAEVPKSKWPVVKLRAVCSQDEMNGFFAKSSEYTEAGNVRVLGVTDIVNRFYANIEELPRANASSSDIKKFNVKYGDILFCRSSLVKEGIGKAALVPRVDCLNILFECHVIRFRLNQQIIEPIFMEQMTWSDDFRRQVMLNSKTTTMTTISQSGLSNIQFPLPPLSLQREFVAIAEKAESAKTALKKSIADIDQVMKGLINQ
ncbi:MAG: restriction endonuclease subunit S [Kiritimatiellae bacterium]|nr:restriction endonuclease subunit S [Kiritimatiellia bacterium]